MIIFSKPMTGLPFILRRESGKLFAVTSWCRSTRLSTSLCEEVDDS